MFPQTNPMNELCGPNGDQISAPSEISLYRAKNWGNEQDEIPSSLVYIYTGLWAISRCGLLRAPWAVGPARVVENTNNEIQTHLSLSPCRLYLYNWVQPAASHNWLMVSHILYVHLELWSQLTMCSFWSLNQPARKASLVQGWHSLCLATAAWQHRTLSLVAIAKRWCFIDVLFPWVGWLIHGCNNPLQQ